MSRPVFIPAPPRIMAQFHSDSPVEIARGGEATKQKHFLEFCKDFGPDWTLWKESPMPQIAKIGEWSEVMGHYDNDGDLRLSHLTRAAALERLGVA